MPRTDLDLNKFKTLLNEEREKAMQSASNADEIFESSQEWETGELTTHDDHQADIASDVTDREQAMVLRDNIRLIVQQIDHALEKIELGTYGFCDECGKEISTERLEFEPYAAYCVEDQAKIEGTS
jgi:RNA polymerase-binding protein DksA